MCGIAGIFGLSPSGRPTIDELEPMAEALTHRGPDENGVYVDGQIGLAHTRLSIVDLVGGRQPMANEDQSVWVVFNGEIYNHVELRRSLEEKGHRFATRSDTEVIAHAYEEWGLECVHRFNGQWAIAVWDKKRGRLVLVRDRVGVRPLFVHRSPERVIFASEIKALARVKGVKLGIEPRALAQIFHFWSAQDATTAFRDVESLPPGHLMVIEGGEVTVRRYWDWQFPEHPDAFPDRPVAEFADELRALLVDAVRLRLRADVPVGAYLSGGVDSSIITAIIKRYTDAPLRTFSVTFEDQEFDESPYQQAVVAHLETHHSSVRCTSRDVGRAFPRTIAHTETPILRTAPTPLMKLSGLVREHGFKVVLTGEGADEVFGGYDLFKEAQVRRFWARRPGSTMRPRLLERLYPYLAASPTASQAYAQNFFGQMRDQVDAPDFGHLPRWSTAARSWRFFSTDLREAIGDYDPRSDFNSRLPRRRMNDWAPLCRDQYVEAHTLLSSYLLSSQGDRMGMANSVEGRFPFLDHRVIEFGNQLPILLKVMGLKEKFLLRRALGDLLPAGVARRTKQPYRAPDSRSFFIDGKPLPYVSALLASDRLRQTGLFDPDAVGKLTEKCGAGKAIGAADNQAFVGILSTMLVDEVFVRGTSWRDISPEGDISQ